VRASGRARRGSKRVAPGRGAISECGPDLSITPAPQRAGCAFPAGEETFSADRGQIHRIQRDAADGDLVLFGELHLLLRRAVPRGEQPAGVVAGPMVFEIPDRIARRDVGVAEDGGAVEQLVVDLIEGFHRRLDEVLLHWEILGIGRLVAALDAALAAFHVTRADLDADRHAFLDPFPFFHAAAEVAGIDMHAQRIAVDGVSPWI
jgi:FAD/FMN-containing dehydrogenase